MRASVPIRTALLLCGAIVLYAPHASAACDGTPLASGGRSIEVDGVQRTFLVRVSSAYEGRAAAPVVITFHPFGMNAQYMQGRISLTRTWPEAVTIHAEALGGGGAGPSWQTGGPENNQDIRYVDALLAWLGAEACIDPARVFVLGYSNGAQFANLLACHRREAIAAVASAAGRLPCAPDAAVPVIMSHGLRDQTIPYGDAIEAARAWTTVNRCTAPPQTGAPGCSAAEACAASPLALCTHAGGHEYDATFTARAVEFFKNVR